MTSQKFYPRNSIRKILSALLLVGALGYSSRIMADSISQSLSFRLYPDATGQVLHFQPFDLSLGALESVGISFEATRRHDIAIWNALDQAAAVAYNASLTGTSLLLDGESFGFADLVYGPANTGPLGSVSIPDFISEFQTGRTQFNAGLNPVYPSAFNPDSTLTALTGLYSPLGFISDLNLSYNPGLFSIVADNAFSASLVDVVGSATVTYNFKAVSVPDSSLGLLVPALLMGLMVVARRRRSVLT